MWHKHFENLLNSCQDFSKQDEVLGQFTDIQYIERFTVFDVVGAMKQLKKGKSPGLDGVSSEHFIYAHDKVAVLSCLLFNSMLAHGYLPANLMSTIVIPLIKDKKGDITDHNNYRPIALTCVSSKILELILLNKYKDCFYTNDSQFGFKAKHSTDLCTFVLKEIIDFYVSHSSPIYICFMDASKAFDKVNHWILFKKLLKRGVPKFIVRLLSVWYSSQKFYIKWSNKLSSGFNVSNGVRQGGIMSPILFNLYVDELSNALTNTRVGCCIGSTFTNHLLYADDSVILAPSPYALQVLLNVCETFALSNDMVYNVKKTVAMCIKPRCFKDLTVPSIFLYGKELSWVDEHKYLGIFITSCQSDFRDIRRQMRAIYARGNILIRKFGKCSVEVKLQLFRSYLGNMYCSELWSHYKETEMKRLRIAYNNVYRMFMGVKSICSISKLYVQNGVDGFQCLRRKSITNFRQRILDSVNSYVCAVRGSSHFIFSSHLQMTWHKLIYTLT